MVIKKNATLYPQDITNEFSFLLQNYQIKKFKNILYKSQLPLSEPKLLSFIDKIQKNNVRLIDIFKIRRHIFNALKSFQKNKAQPGLRSLTWC